MLVLEYEHKVNELSRFCLTIMPNEEENCKRFEEGLWTKIQKVLTASTYPSLRMKAQAEDRVTLRALGMAKHHRDNASFSGPIQLLEVVGQGGEDRDPEVEDQGPKWLRVRIRVNHLWLVQLETFLKVMHHRMYRLGE